MRAAIITGGDAPPIFKFSEHILDFMALVTCPPEMSSLLS